MMTKPTVHTDCFAYNETENDKQQCCALTERICNHKECRFYKTWDDCDTETKKLTLEQKQFFLSR